MRTVQVASRHRYSIACFVDPDADSRIAVHPRFIKEGEVAKYSETTGLKFLLMKLREAQGSDGDGGSDVSEPATKRSKAGPSGEACRDSDSEGRGRQTPV